MRTFLATALLCAIALPASAQNAITQEGTVLKDAPMMFKGNNRARQGATVNGGLTGQTVTTGDSVVGGRCDYSAPIDVTGGYAKLCLNAKDGSIELGGTNPPAMLKIIINGTVYEVPLSAAIVGSDAVVGSNGGLKTVPGSVGKRLTRLGFYAPGDGGVATYNWSATNCAAADDGAQVQPTGVTGCWIADFDAIRANVRQWGAKGDCVTDDGPALQKSLAVGVPVRIPEGHYLISTGGTYSTKPVHLYGDGYAENGLVYDKHCDLTQKGSYLVQTTPGTSMFTLSGAAIRGSSFDNFAVLQLHSAPSVSWAPTVYPPVWSLVSTVGTVDISRIGLGGIYAAVDSTVNSARTHLSNIKGQVFSYLFRNDYSLDINRAEDIHIWPFWSADTNVIAWQYNNTDVLKLRRQDGFQADRLFSLGQRSCIRFSQWDDTNPGAPTEIDIGSLGCDVAKQSVWIDSTVSFGSVIRINSLWHSSGDLAGTPIPGSNAIVIDGAFAVVQIHNMNVLMTAQSVVKQTNVNGGSIVQLGAILPGGFPARGWNYSGSTAFAGTFPVISDASPVGGESTYSILYPIFPQNAGSNVDAGFSAGIINPTSKAHLFMATDDQAWRLISMTTGSTYVWPNWASSLFLNALAPVASVIVKLPKSPLDGKALSMTCDTAVTTLTVTPDDGSTFILQNPPTSCTAGQSFLFKANLAGTPSWRTLK